MKPKYNELNNLLEQMSKSKNGGHCGHVNFDRTYIFHYFKLLNISFISN